MAAAAQRQGAFLGQVFTEPREKRKPEASVTASISRRDVMWWFGGPGGPGKEPLSKHSL